jgi:hypothetical protein
MDRYKKAEQVVPVDFTILDHISDPDAFTKKTYELEGNFKFCSVYFVYCRAQILILHLAFLTFVF